MCRRSPGRHSRGAGPAGRPVAVASRWPMAYQSLYRRYRPQTLRRVVGQEHVVARAAQRRRRGPGGPRLPLQRAPGHGQDLDRPHPGQGPQLRGPGRRRAVRRLPAVHVDRGGQLLRRHRARRRLATTASTTSATSSPARRWPAPGGPARSTSSTRSTCCRRGPSAALLKTLEEPPDHVVFVLATTDPQKVLPTIRSRTQHFEFRLLPAAELAAHVRWIIADAGLEVERGRHRPGPAGGRRLGPRHALGARPHRGRGRRGP